MQKGECIMNEEMVWSKTILTVYRYLERVSNAIDKIVRRSGLSSGNIYGQNYLRNNVLSISQKMIDLSERKVTLINLKVLTDEIFTKMKKEDACLLIERYIDGKKVKDIALKHNFSIRTAFRKIEIGEIFFTKALISRGFVPAKLEKQLSGEKWILRAYEHIKSKREDVSPVPFLANAVSM